MIRSTGNRPPIRCGKCRKRTTEPRNGLCFACYQRDRRGHSTGAACAVCALADPRVLRRHRLGGTWETLCANHSAIAGRRALTLEELRAECFPSSDRRRLERRHADRRATPERRTRIDVDKILSDDKRTGPGGNRRRE